MNYIEIHSLKRNNMSITYFVFAMIHYDKLPYFTNLKVESKNIASIYIFAEQI